MPTAIPFDLTKLILTSQHGVPDAPKTWIYTSTADIAEINTLNYFLAASRLLKAGDTILVHSLTGGVRDISVVYVNAVVADTSIDVTDGLSLITGLPSGGKIFLNAILPNVSSAQSVYIKMPVAGTISNTSAILGGVITLVDSILSIKNGGNTLATLTIPYDGSAAGDEVVAVPAANEVVAAGDIIRISTNGASTGDFSASLTLELTPSSGADSD